MVAKQVAIICGLILLANAGSVVEKKISPVKGKIGEQCAMFRGTGVEIETFDVTPYPPQRNGNINLDAVVKADKDVDIVALHVKVKYAGVDFYAEDLPASASIAAGQTHEFTNQVYLPGIAPPGKYNILTYYKNKDGSYLDCWEVDFSL